MLHEESHARAALGEADPADFSGVWINPNGTQLTLTQAGSAITGKADTTPFDPPPLPFDDDGNPLPPPPTEPGKPTTGDITGFVAGDRLSVIIRWREYQAVSTWEMFLRRTETGDALESVWQMQKQVDPGSTYLTYTSGYDTFSRKK